MVTANLFKLIHSNTLCAFTVCLGPPYDLLFWCDQVPHPSALALQHSSKKPSVTTDLHCVSCSQISRKALATMATAEHLS
mgnify:CR=1 FL=1